MSQGSLEDKIRDSFGSMDESYHKEAMARKEAIWESVSPDKEKKRKNPWWILLLIGPMFFLGGWFFSEMKVTNEKQKIVKEETILTPIATNREAELDEITALLRSSKRQLDSLAKANDALALLVSQNTKAVPVPYQTKVLTITDTLYVKEVKIEQRLVEKIVRDTIVIEVPIQMGNEPEMADLNEQIPQADIKGSKGEDKKVLPASVQFNFSEVDTQDK